MPDDAWNPTPDVLAGVQRLLELARTHLGTDIAWLSHFDAGQQVIRTTSGDATAMHVAAGDALPVEGSFCVRVLAGTLPAAVPDARRDPVTRELAVTSRLGIGSYVGAPVRGPAGEVRGMLCCLGRTANPELDQHAARYAALVADLVSDHLNSAASTGHGSAHRQRGAVEELLTGERVSAAFQPLVRLADGAVVGFEALARFDHPAFPGPAHAFAAATGAGLGVELELLTARHALAGLARVPAGTRLSVNLSAEALLDPRSPELLLSGAERARATGRRLGVEITEHTQVPDYRALAAVVEPLRERGVALLVDDAGAGYASLRHILRLHPDVIKADVELVRGVETDPVR
ncbi:EAL domain-containing protein, partial [Kineococcus glutinatus]|uniref:EAL domain-containing protein n=1 Tax=Kineococcus glutinatus TaxID=1070872 RepID=UPI0031EDFBDC